MILILNIFLSIPQHFFTVESFMHESFDTIFLQSLSVIAIALELILHAAPSCEFKKILQVNAITDISVHINLKETSLQGP